MFKRSHSCGRRSHSCGCTTTRSNTQHLRARATAKVARARHLGARRAHDNFHQAHARNQLEYWRAVDFVNSGLYFSPDDERYWIFPEHQINDIAALSRTTHYARIIKEAIVRLGVPAPGNKIRVSRTACLKALHKFSLEFDNELAYWNALENQETQVRMNAIEDRLLVEEEAAAFSSRVIEERHPEMKRVMQRFSAENHVLRTGRRRGQPLADNLAREFEKLMRKQRSLETVCSEEASDQYCSDCGGGGVRREEHVIGFCSSDMVQAYWCLGFSKISIGRTTFFPKRLS